MVDMERLENALSDCERADSVNPPSQREVLGRIMQVMHGSPRTDPWFIPIRGSVRGDTYLLPVMAERLTSFPFYANSIRKLNIMRRET